MFCILLPLISIFANPVMEKPQYSQWDYIHTVLFDHRHPDSSPKLEMALSLFQINRPPEQAAFFNKILYASDDPISYKDRVIQEHINSYRDLTTHLEELGVGNPPMPGFDWQYSEKVILISPMNRGIVIERTKETYTGGAHSMRIRQYFVIDLESLKLLKIDDFFSDYRGERMRSLIYEKLRKYSSLEENQPLSEGIYFDDEPELTSNFYVKKEGLVLHWDPYEIAPYSEGTIQITLPWKDIRRLMLHSGMELLTKFGIYLFV